jgi:transposase
MSYVRGEDRGQAALLPAAIDDYVTADTPVRVIDAFVDGLDVSGLGFGRSVPAATGRPPYDPRDLLKLYVYGYLNEVRSSRRLERECSGNESTGPLYLGHPKFEGFEVRQTMTRKAAVA